ncbi:MAG TPA: glycosyltransferase family 1 protein [Candidatus Binatia bacterium]|nr:glycosyltransferase family 1 protein [Candidatus Binatia bacterium]
MIHIYINSLAASAGGGLTYVRNVIPHLARHSDVRVTVTLSPTLHGEVAPAPNIEFVELELPAGKRFWYEQRMLPELIRRSGATILLSTGNFALRKSPVPQILLSRNSLYVSPDFDRDLWSRGEYRMWLNTRAQAFFAKRSIRWATATVAPTEAFARQLETWTGAEVIGIHHGFDKATFAGDDSPLPAQVQAQIDAVRDSVKVLFVSHYNYYRNFETLIRALPILRTRMASRSVRLLLTCRLSKGMNPGAYRTETIARLVKELEVPDMVVELGTIPYQNLHRLYAAADIYVTPAYAETFAHPLVEAMASGVPVIASGIPVHREICHDAAVYFERFSPEALAERISQVASDLPARKSMVAKGLSRAEDFSWKVHVERIIALSRTLLGAASRL